MALGRTLILKLAELRPVESLVRKSFLFRPVVKRFIAGDTLEESIAASEELCKAGLLVTLDYLGENTHTEEESRAAITKYKEMLTRIGQSPYASMINISIKLTQCGLDQGEAFAEANYREVLEHAKLTNTFVRIDMEASEYTERTVRMIERVFLDYPNTGTVLQSYLHRSLADTELMIALGARVRVVKGAYLEPASVAFPEKNEVDAKYVEMSKMLLARGNYPAIATHDEAIIKAVREFAVAEGIEKSRYEFQMLYGIRRDLQNSLHAEGHPVRVYVPFGDQWYPYFTRRLAERPANAMFILKSLFKK
ncbi:MAG: proline dehydrogenase family protein [Chthonomonas sp.]|nr:proline dehydrogenase family protein [Chthonomonas sp.]